MKHNHSEYIESESKPVVLKTGVDRNVYEIESYMLMSKEISLVKDCGNHYIKASATIYDVREATSEEVRKGKRSLK
mgnify:CR=1 FL=1